MEQYEKGKTYSTHNVTRNSYKIWQVSQKEKTTPKTQCRCEHTIKIDPKETGQGVDWIHAIQETEWWHACVNTVVNGCVP